MCVLCVCVCNGMLVQLNSPPTRCDELLNRAFATAQRTNGSQGISYRIRFSSESVSVYVCASLCANGCVCVCLCLCALLRPHDSHFQGVPTRTRRATSLCYHRAKLCAEPCACFAQFHSFAPDTMTQGLVDVGVGGVGNVCVQLSYTPHNRIG